MRQNRPQVELAITSRDKRPGPDDVPEARVWLPLPKDDAWTVEALVVRQGGQAVVAELRVRPADPGRTVPAGGLPVRALRELRLGEIAKEARVQWEQEAAADPDWEATIRHWWAYLARPGGRQPGRRGHPAAFYAALAADYARLVRAGDRRPVATLAAQRNYSVAAVREFVHQARRRGYLTRGAQGRASGELTEAARAVLAKCP